jgi:hypothetical protein
MLSRAVGVPRNYTLDLSWQLWYVVAVATVLLGTTMLLCLLVLEVRGNNGSIWSAATWTNVLGKTFPPTRTLSYLVVFFTLPFLARTFLAFKASISHVTPFGPWDQHFMSLDRWLHFGHLPSDLLQPVLGFSAATQLLDFVYYTWFPVLWMTVTWQAWYGDRDTTTRAQFLLSFALTWILLGTLAATLFSSAGPVYYARVTGAPDVYAPLMGYLHAVDIRHPIKALWTQDLLWTSYSEGKLSLIGGISAMPSLHVAMSTLLALFGFRVNRLVGWAYMTFAILIFIGSIHLGWHYAIDGYAGALGTTLIWLMSGWLVSRWYAVLDRPDRS